MSADRSGGPGSGLVDALGLTTVCPVPARAPSRRVVLWLPVVGILVGAASFVPALAVWRGLGGGAPLLAGVLIVAAQALLTRGLHLDGLADLADGLGSRRPPEQALEIMKRSDIGPFGVSTVLLTLLVQAVGLGTVLARLDRPAGLVVVLVVAATARVCVVSAAHTSVPSARPGGFGALVAGSVGTVAAVAVAAVSVGAAFAVRWVTGDIVEAAVAAGAVVAGLVAARAVQGHAVRRLGGVTGDVFGALVEVGATAAVLVFAIEAAWS